MGGEHEGDKNEHQNKRQEDKDPGNGLVSRFTNDVEQPSPEKDVNNLENENNGDERGFASV